ncbi:MAG: hypothetical protein KDE50_02720, partial [Caldilineaceae bacterium]|nr:hypothetical protein [Caldilineaceae bacterium]
MASTQDQVWLPNYSSFYIYMSDAAGNRHPGVRAVEPAPDSAQAIRGNLYVAVELFRQDRTAVGAEASRIAEHMLGSIQSTYYSAKGSQSQVFTAAMQSAHQLLQEVNGKRSAEDALRAGVMCISFLNGHLMLAATGPVLALLVTEQAVEQFPSHGEQEPAQLGGAAAPPVQIIQRDAPKGGAFYIGSSTLLNHIPIRTLLGSLTRTNADNLADVAAFLSQASLYAPIPGILLVVEPHTATISEFESPSSPQAARDPEANAPAQPASLRRGAASGLPTSVYASPPVHSAPLADEPATEQRATRRPPATQPGQSEYAPTGATPHTKPAAAAAPMQAAPMPAAQPEQAADADRRVGDTKQQAAPAVAEQMRRQFQRARAAVSGTLTNVLPGGSPPPQKALPSTPGEPRGRGRLVSAQAPATETNSRLEAVTHAASSSAERLAQASSNMTKAAVSGATETVHQFRPPTPASGSRARMFASAAVVIALLVPIIVAAVVWQRGATARAEGEERYEEARARFLGASTALDAGDKVSARSELTEAQSSLQMAQMLLGNQPKISALSQEIQRALQEVLQVWPLYKLVEPLVRFPADAQPWRILVVDQDIYILDTGRDLVLRFHMDAESGQITDEAGEVVLSRGETIAGQTVTDLIDMSWQAPIPGIEDKANLIVLDSSNHVFRYNQRVEGAGLLPFYGQESWQSPSQIEVYSGRVYVADGVSGQIYRYDPVEPDAYMQEPQPWLLTPFPTGLTGVQSMAIDGDIWLLFSDGKLLRFNQGQQSAFALDTAVGLMTNPVDMFVGNQENSAVYIADAGQERILVFDKEGSYKRQLQAAEGNPLRDLSGIF